MKNVYDHVDDIDLFIGMIQEKPVGEHDGDAKVGKTLQCLIGDVFSRLRSGDRYFYDNANEAGSFTPGIDDFSLPKIQDQLHSLIRGILTQSFSSGAKNFTKCVFYHVQFSGVI